MTSEKYNKTRYCLHFVTDFERWLLLIIFSSFLCVNIKWQWSGWGLWYFMPFSTIFQLYRGSHFYWRRKPEETTDLPWQTLSHNVCREHLAWDFWFLRNNFFLISTIQPMQNFRKLRLILIFSLTFVYADLNLHITMNSTTNI